MEDKYQYAANFQYAQFSAQTTCHHVFHFTLVLFLTRNIFKKADLDGGVVRKWKKKSQEGRYHLLKRCIIVS